MSLSLQLRSLLPLAFCLAVLLGSPAASAKERLHTVYSGQRLASIAKRYNLTVEELCLANGLDKKARIQPGQQLIIPERDAQGAIVQPSKKPASASATAAPAAPKKVKKRLVVPEEPSVHLVARGNTLSAISHRYQVGVPALCLANGILPKTRLKVGQVLVIPAKSDPTGEYARQVRLTGAFDQVPQSRGGGSKNATYKKYQKAPWRKGYVTLSAHGQQWKGYVVGPDARVLTLASTKINWAMGSSSHGPSVDPRLIRLLAQVSDQFGGRPLRIVSGYRTKSFVAASKHKEGRAVDFSIDGVPNEALRDYLRTLRNVGVGYYPNSSFVHLDVRGYNAFWIDYAGPGESPRKHPRGTRSKLPSHDPAQGHAPGVEPPSEAVPVVPESEVDEPPDDTAPDPTGGEEPPAPPPPLASETMSEG